MFVPTGLQGMRKFAFAGTPSAPPGSVGLIDVWLVHRSASGLPSASVSNGTEAGRFVPRSRRYCELLTPFRRNTKVLNCASSPGFQVVSLTVRMMCALVFLA